MKRTIDKLICRACGQATLCVACLVTCAAKFEVHAQELTTLPPPANSKLQPVHFPDVTTLEADVRQQLTSAQSSLAFSVQNHASIATLSEAFGGMGELYHAYSLFSPAAECYRNASLLTPKEFRWVYLLGLVQQHAGRVNDAIINFRIARTIRPDYPAVSVNLGNVFLELNRLAEAESSFREALAIEKNNAAAHYGLGQIALSKRNYKDAVDHFEAALAQLPDANRIHYSLAMAYRGLGDLEKARTHLAQRGPVGVKVADPLLDELRELIKSERVHLIRGKLALGAQRYDEAADEFRKAVTANPNSVSAHLNLGTTLTQTGELRAAAAEFETVLRIDSRNTLAHFNLAVLLTNRNEHEQAIAHLRSILTVEPNDRGARMFLAQELKKSARFAEASAEFSLLVQADPNNEEALLEQVRLLTQEKQHQKALDILEEGHTQFPQKGRTAVMLAYLLAASPQYDLRDGRRALQLSQKIYEAADSPEHGALVAMALAELGRCSEAAQWQRRMIVTAEQQQKTEMLAKLRSGLKQYEQTPPCRPSTENGWPGY
ncbi:MAG TPA: tetratricopeptide repeat protein [Pyrinomonadaceae bacterium]|jgi:tetratricopeptide (TPR) repeat protein|nr:tetratricopeptide repeat protein [Pyrinomonadaceae bacterium]